MWNIFELRSHIGVVSNDLMAQVSRDITGRELVLSGFFGSIGIGPNHHVTPEMESIALAAMKELEVSALADRWLMNCPRAKAAASSLPVPSFSWPGILLLDEPATSLDGRPARSARVFTGRWRKVAPASSS